MRKPAITPVPKRVEDRARFDQALKESLEIIMGRRGTPIALLDPATATASDCAAKINELLAVLQG